MFTAGGSPGRRPCVGVGGCDWMAQPQILPTPLRPDTCAGEGGSDWTGVTPNSPSASPPCTCVGEGGSDWMGIAPNSPFPPSATHPAPPEGSRTFQVPIQWPLGLPPESRLCPGPPRESLELLQTEERPAWEAQLRLQLKAGEKVAASRRKPSRYPASALLYRNKPPEIGAQVGDLQLAL